MYYFIECRMVVILDTAEEEEESDATKKGLENGTEENRIGQEGERRKSYSAAVIDGIKRKSRIFVGDSETFLLLSFGFRRKQGRHRTTQTSHISSHHINQGSREH